MQKKLPYEISSIGFYPADMMALSILEAYKDTDALLYGFYNMFGNFCYLRGDKTILNAELNWECPLLCRKLVPRTILENNKDISLINFISSCIDAGYYVYITMDRSKIKCYSCYGGAFLPHPLVIYGYDDIDRLFFMADFTDGAHYEKAILTFDELITSNATVSEYMKKLDTLSGSNEWILDIELVKYLENYNMIYNMDYIRHQMEIFIHGRGLYGNTNSIHKRSQPQIDVRHGMANQYYEAEISDEFYGINVLKKIVEHLNNCLNDSSNKFNFRHIYLISAYLKLLILKVKKLCGLLNIKELKKVESLLSELEIQEKELDIAIKLAIKYSMTMKPDTLERVIAISESGVDCIEKANVIMIEVLNNQVLE